MLGVIRKDLPEDVLKLSEEDREINPWVKCKKWAFANLYRLFYRYAAPRKIGSNSNEYSEFSQIFITTYVPGILKVYFEQIEVWVQKKIWLGNASIYNILAFLEECIGYKETWVLLKPHTDIIISHVVFPLLCTTENDLEIFETDPAEYIHKHIDVYEESPTPDVAATNFLVTLIRKRSRHTLNSLLTFIQGIVTRHMENTQDLELARQQEAALRMMGSISHIVLSKKSSIADKMEPFIAQYVFPDFTSPHGFLRARACEFLNHYAEVKFENVENIFVAYQSVLSCMDDEHLPVQIEAALALQPMVHHEGVHASLAEKIPEVMTRLLDLANKVDIDAISGVIGEFVEVFSEQLKPFAVDLATRMCVQLTRLLGELVEQQNVDFDAVSYDDIANEDKTMTVLGLLNTMSTLLIALDNANSVIIQIENILRPVIEIIFRERLSEFYADVFGLIENCTYCLKGISPTMWELFTQMHAVFKDDAIDYLNEIFPSIDNYLQYGSAEIGENQQLKEILFDIFHTVMTNEGGRFGAEDKATACSIAQKMLLSLNGKIDSFVPRILKLVASSIAVISEASEKSLNTKLLVNLLEVVLASICYNAQATLKFLEDEQATQQFFTIWFQKMELFKRVYDLKLVVLAMLSLFRLPDSDLPDSIRSNLSQIAKGLVSVLKKYPEAVHHRAEMDKEFDSGIYSAGDDFFDDEWDENEDDDGDGDEVKTKEYLDFLESQSSTDKAIESLIESDLEEEPLSETVLDNIDPNAAVRETFFALKSVDPNRYKALTHEFTPEEVTILENAIAA